MPDACASRLAIVLKGYPRVSEPFIASEIYRLERAGIAMRLIVITPTKETITHPVVDEIAARCEYLPATSSVSDTCLVRWLAKHLPAFAPALVRTSVRRPLGTLRAAFAAATQAVRARPRFWSLPRKAYAKEFLQAVAVADRIRSTPDVRHLHAHFCHRATTVTWLASLISGLPFSFTAHAKDVYTPALNPAGLLPRKLRAARFAVSCTEASRRYLQGMAGQTPVRCVYHGLTVDFTRLIASGRQPDRQRADSLRVLAVGRLVRKKGFDLLLDACTTLDREGIDWCAVIVGEDGDAAADLRRTIAERGWQGRVRLAGPQTQVALFEEYRRATVFCLPCRVLPDGDRDGIPNVLVEAMACRLPVVTTAVSSIPELVSHRVNGWLVTPDDASALASALIQLHTDRALATALGDRGAETVRVAFDGDRHARALAELFQPLLA